MISRSKNARIGVLDAVSLLTTTVEGGSFAAAARKLGVTSSAVSRRVALLEDELGVQLLARTTRTLRLTEDGRAFHERCVRILEEWSEAKAALVRARAKPAGVLRVDAAIAIARQVLTPNLPDFLGKYRDVEVELTVRDQRIDPVAEGVDVLLRIGALADPASRHSGGAGLVAKKLGESEVLFVAAPSYVAGRGMPEHPEDLVRHDVLGYLRGGRPDPWLFQTNEGVRAVEIAGRFHANDVDALSAGALAGRGLVAAFDFLVADHLREGRLVRVLPAYRSTVWPIHALYPPNRHLLPKVRAFVDFVAPLFSDSKSSRAARRTPPRG